MPRYDYTCAEGHELLDHVKTLNEPVPACPECGGVMETLWRGVAPGVVGDDIPGGLVVKHLTAQPQKFYSKTEIKRAANELGWVGTEDTPKPYAVKWSGKRKDLKAEEQ